MLVTFLGIPEHPGTTPCPVWAGHSPLLVLGTQDMGRWLLASWWRGQHLQALLCWSARSGKGLDGECSESRGQTSNPTPRLWGPPLLLFGSGQLLPASLSSGPGVEECGDVLGHWLRLLHREW